MIFHILRVMKHLRSKKSNFDKCDNFDKAGGINTNFKPGDLVIIDDHINLTGKNPLIGKNNDELGPRFPDMTFAYSKDLSRDYFRSSKVN